MSDDYAADTQTTGSVAVGGSATGTIETAHDQDWFAVELVAGRTYVIDLRGNPTDDGTLRDPYLRGIYDADGNRISNTTDDDGGEGYNSRVTFTATESGTHYIAAGAYSSRRGTYEVEVTDTSPPIVGPDPDSRNPPDRQEQVQQEPPTFGSQFYAFDLAEDTDDSANRLSLGTVSATDPDSGSVTYSIEGGNESGRFELDAASGELFYVGAGEDYETGSTRFELTVRASDGEQTTDATVTVDVTDMAEAPAFAQAGYAFDLAENADGSVARISLGTVLATDPDGGSVSYGIAGGNGSGLFEIDAASGELFLHGRGRGLRDRCDIVRPDGARGRRGSDDPHHRDCQCHRRGRAGGSRSAGYGAGSEHPADGLRAFRRGLRQGFVYERAGGGRRHGHGQDRE